MLFYMQHIAIALAQLVYAHAVVVGQLFYQPGDRSAFAVYTLPVTTRFLLLVV